MLPNVWDAATARIVERAGFPAIATSSAAVGGSLGPGDGERMTAEEAFAAIARVTAPVERLFGFTLLGATTYQGVKNAGNSNGNGTLGP